MEGRGRPPRRKLASRTIQKKGNDMSSDEIDVKPEQAIAPRPADRFAEYAQNRAALDADFVRLELGSNQMDAILTATTEEELNKAMEMAGLVGLRDIPDGTELEIRSFHYAPGTRSDYANRWGIFAVMDCVYMHTGVNVAIDTGVERIITWLRAMESLDAFPAQRRVVKTETGGGNFMITLLPLNPRVVETKK